MERKELIKDALNRKGHVSVSEIAALLDVSDVSVRRYFEELERDSFLFRTYGGAIKREDGIPSDFFFNQKEKKNLNEKKAIAKTAASLVKNGETIFLDTGTTALEIARLLSESGKKLVVVTNSLPIVSELSKSANITVFALGGFLRRELMDFSGYFIVDEIQKLVFEQSFLGVDGISAEEGLTTNDKLIAEIEEAVMDKSRVINIVADFSKIGKVSLLSYGDIKARKAEKRLITDNIADIEELKKLQKAGFEIKVALSSRAIIDNKSAKTVS